MRIDVYLFTHDHVKSRQSAKVLIENGNVKIDGKKISKPSFDIDETLDHTVEITEKPRFVSRGGEKLDFALDSFAIDPRGLSVIDIGASTGGFTDCLLQRGVGEIYAVDSGHGQLDPSIESDERVVSVEKYNAKFMSKEDFPTLFDIAVMDVSFISQTYIHKGIADVLKDGGVLISLIKPQFECGKVALNSKGVVKKSSYHAQAIARVIDSALICGFSCMDIVRSPIEGGSGNVEFLGYFVKSEKSVNYVSENKIKLLIQAK